MEPMDYQLLAGERRHYVLKAFLTPQRTAGCHEEAKQFQNARGKPDVPAASRTQPLSNGGRASFREDERRSRKLDSADYGCAQI